MKRLIMIITAAVSVFMLSSCDKRFVMDLPLAVASHTLNLSKDSGSTHVLVYADGPWTASFTSEVDWASLNKLSGEGNSDLVFSYAANFGIARKVGIVLTKGELRDTVNMIQAGPVTSPSYKFNQGTHSLAVGGGNAYFDATSNLYYSCDAIILTAIYDPEGKKDTVRVVASDDNPDHWIKGFKAEYNSMMMELDYNLTKADRKADIIVTVDDPTGRNMRSLLKLTQTASAPKFMLSAISGTYESDSQQSIVVPATLNNIYAYRDDTIIVASGSPDWVKDIRLTAAGLEFSLEKNTTKALRSTTVTITYMDMFAAKVTTKFTIAQKG